MTKSPKVIVVGGPTFRQDVALAMEMSPEAVRWFPRVIDVKDDDADVIALSPSVGDDEAIQFAEATLAKNPRASMVLVRKLSQNGMLPGFMRAGFRDVVDLSRDESELKEALQRAVDWSRNLRILEEAGDAHLESGAPIVMFFSSKGGTGKSFLSSNVAAALADRSGRDTALLDLDLDMGDVFSYYGMEPDRSVHDLLLSKELDLEAVRASATRLGDHLYGFGAPLDPGAERAHADEMQRMLGAMKKSFEFVVLDAPAEYSDHVIAALDMADTICLVAGLDVVGIKHLVKARETLTGIGIPLDRLRVVLNRADSKVALSPQDVEKVIGMKIDTMIPSSRLVPMSLNKGVLTYAEEPEADVSQAVGLFAERLAASFGIPKLGNEHPKKHRRFLRKG